MFENADVPVGPSAYAEHFAADTFLKMPANALVSVGYLLVGGGLKKADFVLAEAGLTRFTGHFWLKVADFLQIHFAAAFFLRTEPASWPKSVSSSLARVRQG